MLKKRVFTAIFWLPLIVLVLTYGGKYGVQCLLTVCASICMYETLRIMVLGLGDRLVPKGEVILRSKFFRAYLVSGAVFFFVAGVLPSNTREAAWVLFLLAGIGFGLFSSEVLEHRVTRMVCVVFSTAYGLFPWASLGALFDLQGDSSYIFLLMGIVMGSDTGAYFGGKFLGKRKLAPTISPKKTWEGVYGGLLLAIGGAYLVKWLGVPISLNGWALVGTAVAVAAAGVIGDLVESSFKRFAGIKDSGNLFPGHGGLLDRVDGIIFAAPVLWFATAFFKGP